MEELRSTEVLDKEIRADARKKAEKILDKADVDCRYIIEEVSQKVKEAEQSASEKTEERVFIYEKNLNASLPLEKERFKVSFIQSSIEKAIDEYLGTLSENELLNLVIRKLNAEDLILKERKFNAYYYGFSESGVKKILSEQGITVASLEKTDFNKIIIENNCGITENRGIVLDADDKSVRLRLTLAEVISQILDRYRNELYDALFGGRLA
ncbi:MAG: hypothetical protein II098_11495 [Treponema sp.]|nr:hypothetical protein [Treponema sp.]